MHAHDHQLEGGILFAAVSSLYSAVVGNNANSSLLVDSCTLDGELHGYTTQVSQLFASSTYSVLSSGELPSIVSSLLKTPEMALAAVSGSVSDLNSTLTTAALLDPVAATSAPRFLTAGLRTYAFEVGNGDATVWGSSL
jgi:hypothetical protein